jgi:EmrB/QacA subfamily drug resistance transporter
VTRSTPVAGGPAASEAPAAARMSHRQVLAVLSGLMLGMFLAALDQSVVGTALKTIVTDLGGADHVSWVVAAYLITSTASTPLYGKLSDLYGRKPVYQFVIGVFLLGSVLAGLSQNMWQLILFRAIQGLGGGGLLSLAMTIVADIVSPRDRGRYQGYFGAVFGLSSVAGPLLGGFFTDALSWHWIFFINVPVGVLAWFVIGAKLNIPHVRRRHHVDYAGAATLVAGVSAALLVTQWGGHEYAWTSPQVIGLVAVAVALLAAFVLVERRSPEPILPLRLFRNRTFTLVNIGTFVVGAAMFGAIIYVPFYLQLVRGYSATAAGLLMLPLMVGIIAASVGSGRVISRIGRYKPFPVAGTAILTAGLLLMSRLTVQTPIGLIAGVLVVIGAGVGLTMQTLVIAVQNDSDPAELGVATSAVSFSRSLGGATGTAVFGAIVTAGSTLVAVRLPSGAVAARLDLTAYTAAVGHAFLVAAPLAAVAFAVTVFLRDTRLRATSALIARADAARGDTTPERAGEGAAA